MEKPKLPPYGCWTYSCAIRGSLFIGALLALLLELILFKVFYPKAYIIAVFLDWKFIYVGWPIISIVIGILSFFFIWTPKRAFWLISWILQDFWTIGRNIWSDHG